MERAAEVLTRSGLCLEGFIDMHIHTAPDVRERCCDDMEAARAAKREGLRAILIKSHVTSTADRAALAEKYVGGIRVFGGLVLNMQVGGLNPAAVEAALKMGAKEIWFPTFSAQHQLRQEGKGGGVTIFAEDGTIRPEVYEIVDLIHRANAILATGHLSVEETVALVSLARERGVSKIVVTHPEAPFIRMSAELQVALSQKGVFFERCYVNTTHAVGNPVTIQEIAASIRLVGVGSTILSTDFGLASLPHPVDGLREYLSRLADEGFGDRELIRMASENPALLLDI
ncbi:MAG: DUF6282 family protein [Candidatus Methanomethyliaceae archaeon]